MKLKTDFTINGKYYKAGDEVSGLYIFPFFLIHMLAFGGSGFLMAYFADDISVSMLYAHGGIAITVYLVFYLAIFGLDAVKWMFINAGIGLFGIYSELRIFLKYFDKNIADFAWYIHVVPFTYYVLYTFLIYQAVLSFFGAYKSRGRKKLVDTMYILISLVIYLWIFLKG